MNIRTDDRSMLDMTQTVLMVDDREENLASLEAVLDDGKRNILRASSGEEDLRLLLEHTVSLVVLDVQMPLMNGYEVAGFMPSNRKIRNIPIIFITVMERSDSAAILGYQSGARLLKNVSRRLQQQARAYDAVSRIGGDEFTVVLADLERPEDAAAVARKILQALRHPGGVVDDMHVFVSASIGISN